jgi:glucose-1-phosphate adenylyltransferase
VEIENMSILMGRTLAVLLAGGAGERLYPLTRDRAKPAVPFGGTYRVIDLTLSNCVNSGLRRIFVFTQYKSLSLNRHIRFGYFNLFARDLDEFIEVIPPQQRVGNQWYQGTADAVYQNLYSIRSVDRVDFVLVLPGDHIYKMNYFRLLRQHVESNADVTLGAIDVPVSSASRFGVLDVGPGDRVVGFEEKPERPPSIPDRPSRACASMGIYVFKRDVLEHVVRRDAADPDSTHDFGRDILPWLVREHAVYAHHFVDENKKEAQYWMDVGTVESYYQANMDLVAVQPLLNLYDREWPIRTRQYQYPPAKFVFADEGLRMGVAVDSIVSAGCILSGGRVVSSVLSQDVRVNSYSLVERSILFPHVVIGRHCLIKNAIIDRGIQIPEHTVIGYDVASDRSKYTVTDGGIVVVSPERGDREE